MLFDRNPLPMWVIDIETLGFLAVNDAAIRIYGYSREEFLATTTEILHLEADIPKVIDIIHKNPQGFSYTTQWQHRKKDATLIDVDVVSHGVVFNERPARLVLVNDITTRRQLEEERLYAKELAIELEKEREIIELKERFISIVSHEFRTPLSVILSSVDILRIYFDRLTRERITEKLGGIADQVQHMGDLLDDVLMIGRHNAKRVNFVPEPQDIVRLLNTAIEHVRMGDEDRHQFILNFQLQDTMMLVDKRLLEHVFLNLIGNAVKYSPVGTNIYINVKQSNQDIIFSVRDEGIGIPPDDQSRMFEPFYRAKNAFDKRGTGLGLAIVKQSVEALHLQCGFAH
jgi:PAS domain S-box-containing protein